MTATSQPFDGSQLRDGITIVTGCNTDVGKTVAVAVCTALLMSHGLTPDVVKPAQTGVLPGEPGDLSDVARLTGIAESRLHEYVRLDEPLAPVTAARRAGVTLPSIEHYADQIADLARAGGPVLVEGAGGVLVGLADQNKGLLELASALRDRLPHTPIRFVVVADPVLGTLNLSMLTCRAIHTAGHEVAGVIFGSWPQTPDLASRCNAEDIGELTGVPLLLKVDENIGGDLEKFTAFIERMRG